MTDGTKIAERWAGMYETCKEHTVGYQAVVLNVIEELSRSEERERVLREALVKVRFGVQLMVPEPQKGGFLRIIDPVLSTPAALLEHGDQRPCAYIYKFGAQCGHTEFQCMHNGSPSETIPDAGRHDYIPAEPEQGKEAKS